MESLGGAVCPHCQQPFNIKIVRAKVLEALAEAPGRPREIAMRVFGYTERPYHNQSYRRGQLRRVCNDPDGADRAFQALLVLRQRGKVERMTDGQYRLKPKNKTRSL